MNTQLSVWMLATHQASNEKYWVFAPQLFPTKLFFSFLWLKITKRKNLFCSVLVRRKARPKNIEKKLHWMLKIIFCSLQPLIYWVNFWAFPPFEYYKGLQGPIFRFNPWDGPARNLSSTLQKWGFNQNRRVMVLMLLVSILIFVPIHSWWIFLSSQLS